MAEYPATLTYGDLNRTHPDYNAEFWARTRALYAGGRRLLDDDKVMSEVFPRHGAEADKTYTERKKRAFYIPYPGEVIDAIVASLTAKPLSLMTAEGDDEPDEFYQEFYKDCSKPGGKRQSFSALLREQMLHAQQCRVAWTLVDLPTDQPEYKTKAEQDAAGGLRPYACVLEPETVRDWEIDDSGELEWVLIKTELRKREGLDKSRDQVEERFRYYDRDGWAEYRITHKEGEEIAEEHEVSLHTTGGHVGSGEEKGKVPVARLELPEGLFAMGKIESIAIAHFNTRNALSWAQWKTLLPVPVAYLGAGDPTNPATENDQRATGQVHSPGHMRVMAEKDRLEYFSPDASPFETAQNDLAILRDEMHRVLHHMALSVDNSGAALQRSAESKAIDQAVAAVVLAALGGYLRDLAVEIYGLASMGRGEFVEWTAKGMEDFDDTTSSALIDQAVNLSAVDIPSATFQQTYKFSIAKRLLGPDVDEETLEKIREELKSSLSQENVITSIEQAKADLDATQATAEATRKPPPKPAAPGAGKKPKA